MIKLGEKAKQRYFLAPHISDLTDNPFTKGMSFHKIDFNTVFLEKHDLYKEIGKDEEAKKECLKGILLSTSGKTLIYAGTYSNIDIVSEVLNDCLNASPTKLAKQFGDWVTKNYTDEWQLIDLVKRRAGIHNGSLPRSLSQIQVKLFEEEDGLQTMISTSSIIEGVNTSAQNVVIWKSKNGRSNIKDFTYKNIIGRGGRMFRHFVGQIYLLDTPPKEEQTQLDLQFPDELIGDLGESRPESELTQQQLAKIIEYKEDMESLVGRDGLKEITSQGVFESSDSSLVKAIAKNMVDNPKEWKGLGYLNSTDPGDWDRSLFNALKLKAGISEGPYTRFVEFVKILSHNWDHSIPRLLNDLRPYRIGVESFFKMERSASYKLASVLGTVNILQKCIFNDKYDVSPFIHKLSHAFLPPMVHQLEEYGLPRMIAKKIHRSSIIDFLDEDIALHPCLEHLRKMGTEGICRRVHEIDDFDIYLLNHFFAGI